MATTRSDGEGAAARRARERRLGTVHCSNPSCGAAGYSADGGLPHGWLRLELVGPAGWRLRACSLACGVVVLGARRDAALG